MYFLLEKHERKEEILAHRLRTINTQSALVLLQLLEELMTFGQALLSPHL